MRALWAEVLATAIADSRRNLRTRRELAKPSPAIATILALLDVDLSWWLSIAVPGLEAKWGAFDAEWAAGEAKRAARKAELAEARRPWWRRTFGLKP